METKETVQERFSMNMKTLRSIHKMTQSKASEAIGVKLSTYGAWEEGRAVAPPHILIRVSQVFKIPIDDLLKADF